MTLRRLTTMIDDQRGAALILALLVVFSVAALATAVIMIAGDEGLLEASAWREAQLHYAAEYGLERALSRLNHDETALPDSGYRLLLESNPVTDADGQPITGLWTKVYLARTGSAVGQLGNFASLVAEAGHGAARVVKRLEVVEESFAKYAYFTDSEGVRIGFGGGDQILGPLHSNDRIRIWSSGARFRDEVATAQTILGKQYGQFDLGYEENVAPIEMPGLSDLSRLKSLAQQAGYVFRAPDFGGSQAVKMRIEFVAIDVNGDGDQDDEDEGFFRIYRTPQPSALRADWRTRAYDNCGDVHRKTGTGETRFIAANMHQALDGQGWSNLRHRQSGRGWRLWRRVRAASLRASSARCYLGGDPRLTLDGQSFSVWSGSPSGSGWLRRSDYAPGATLPASLGTRPDAEVLFPIHRLYNESFRGVIYVDGTVAVSGRLNGRVTLVSSRNLVVLDDLVYVTPPNTGPCDDILGIIAWRDIAMADNALNSPQYPPGRFRRRTYDESAGETIHAVLMALNTSFFVENYWWGPRREEACEGQAWGRGCLYIGGGLIQKRRGPVGTTAGTGYIKRYAYDQNARYCPPPHFPTTGRYHRNRYYEVNPVGFDAADYFRRLAGQGLR